MIMADLIEQDAVKEVVYIPHNVFLGTTSDMEEIVAAVKKVERHCSKVRQTHATKSSVAPKRIAEPILDDVLN